MIVFHIILQKISANIELEVHNRGKKNIVKRKKKNAVTIIRDPQFPNFFIYNMI